MFGGKSYGAIAGTETLLGFADYKISQIMRKLGILEYSKELADKVDHKIELPHNSPEEIEIRANQLWAIELIRQILSSDHPGLTRVDINDYLWLASQAKFPNDKPYHRTKTITY